MKDMFAVSVIVRARPSNNMVKISGPGPSATASETTNDKKDDLACAMDVKNVKEYDVDGERILFYWPPFRKGSPTIFLPHKPPQMEGGRREVSAPDHYDRVIIEWCCGRNSMFGKSSKHSSGCKVVRLTIDDDLRASEGLQKAIQVFQDCPRGRTLLWSSMLCAGGSPWQTLNVAMGEGLEKIEGHWRDFRFLWSNFELMARAVMDVGGKSRRRVA
jgi:hypothetical protein